MDKERVSVNDIQHTIILVIKLKKFLNYSLLKREHVIISTSHPLEPWFGQTYVSKEIIYTERSAFFLPKASPLMVLTTSNSLQGKCLKAVQS